MVTAQTYLILSGTVGPVLKIETFPHQDKFQFFINLDFRIFIKLVKDKVLRGEFRRYPGSSGRRSGRRSFGSQIPAQRPSRFG